MYEKLIAIVLICFVCSIAFAQEEQEVPEQKVSVNSNRKYKNEFGIDISPLQFVLGSYSTGYPSLFYRRHFIKQKKLKSLTGASITTYQAFRVRIGSNLNFQKFNTPDIRNITTTIPAYNPSYTQNLSSTSSFFIRIGKERQFRSSKFELFYGYDLFFNYSNQRQYNIVVNYYTGTNPYNVNYEYKYDYRTLSYGIAAIAGFKYFLIPRLCFSAEATVNFGYSSQRNYNEWDYYDSSIPSYERDASTTSSSGFGVNINPLYVINVGYYF